MIVQKARQMKIKEGHLIALGARLEEVQKDFHATAEIQNDPIHLVLKFQDPGDREVAALIAAIFAYGNVRQIQSTLREVFSLLGPAPAATLRASTGKDWKNTIPGRFRHRFNTAEDLGLFLTWLGEALRRYETLEDFFFAFDENERKTIEEAGDVGPLLENFITRLTSLPCAPYQPPRSKGALFFLPRPSGKSACKRLLLFLRWVAGTGPMDLHLWTRLPREKLLIPVDTHVLRISRHLGLTRRKDNSWRTAQEITAALKLLDSADPTRFDFALCHLGISRECPSRYALKVCARCRMNDLCLTYARKAKKS